MFSRLFLIFFLFSGCTTLAKRSSCQHALSDLGFVACEGPYVEACGATLLNCEDGASYYCLDEVVCQAADDGGNG